AIEMIAEPYILIAMYRVWERSKVILEMFGLFSRAVILCGLFMLSKWWANEEQNSPEEIVLLGYAYSQLASSILVVLAWILYYVVLISKDNKIDDEKKSDGFASYHDLLPTLFSWKAMANVWKDTHLTYGLPQFFVQSLIKYALTEGDKFVMIALQMDDETKGVFALVSGLGSLVARYMFAPIEKQSLYEFGKLQSETRGDDHSSSSNAHEDTSILVFLLSLMLRVVSGLSLICLTFGPNYSFMFFDIIYGPKWSMHSCAPAVLSLYCLYLLLMSVNGITEAYVSSLVPSAIYNIWLILVTAIYWLCVMYGLQWYGANGLIGAQCVNMSLRIV
ncbi:hypothetical protein RFI_10524, partial [Reticulomyxa filosa]